MKKDNTADNKADNKSHGDAFANIALWQFMAFAMLLCFVWASELLDIPSMVFGMKETPFNLFRVSMLSAAIITAGIVAVGHTYEQQRRLVNELLMTCLYCHRVQTPDGKWEHVEEYFMDNFPVAIERGACPECQAMLSSIDSRRKSAEQKSGKD